MSFESFPTENVEEKNESISPEGGKKSENNDVNLDFENFLEGEVFINLGITIKDEEKYLEAVEHQDNKELMDRVDRISFPNIRDSVRMFFSHYCLKGIYNHAQMRKERKAVEEKAWNDFWQDEGSQVDGRGEKIDSHGRSLNYWENGRMISDRVNDSFPPGYLEKNRIIFNKDEVLKRFFEELAKIREDSVITYNADFESVEAILNSGEIMPMTEQSEDKRVGMRKTGGLVGAIAGSDNEGYDERRREAEEVIGIYQKDGPKPVYAALAGGSDSSRKLGAARQYGEVVLVLNDDRLKDRVVFTEGDSMNPLGLIDPLFSKRDLSPKNGLDHRLLNRPCADIAKAIYSVSRELERPYYGAEDDLIGRRSVQYVEAQILGGVNMKDVKEIIVNNSDGDPWFERGIEEFRRRYPGLAHLIKINETGEF